VRRLHTACEPSARWCNLEFNECTAHNHFKPRPETLTALLTIRNLDPAIKERLRVCAAQHGRSMEAETRGIPQTATRPPDRSPERSLYERIRARFEPVGGVDLELPPREPTRDPPHFD
jgi:antitoxin FitA